MQEATTNTQKTKRSFFSKTKLYLFEYTAMQVANLWIGIAIAVSVFSLFSVISGKAVSFDTVEGLAWVFGLILVFFPISIILYARTTAEEIFNKARIEQVFRKVVFYSMLAIATVSAVGFLSATVYSLVRTLFGIETSSSLVTVTAPSAVIFLFHVYFLSLVLKKDLISAKLRRLNIILLSVVGVTIASVVLALALAKGDSASNDTKKIKDLTKVSSVLNTYYRDNSKLPTKIDDIKSRIGNDLLDKFDKGTYSFKVLDSNSGYDQPAALEGEWDSSLDATKPSIGILPPESNQYQLCATFETSQNGGSYYYGDEFSTSSMSYLSRDLSYHPKGYYCFTLSAY